MEFILSLKTIFVWQISLLIMQILTKGNQKPNQLQEMKMEGTLKSVQNTPGTRGGPGGRDRTLAVKSRKSAKNHFFFVKKEL